MNSKDTYHNFDYKKYSLENLEKWVSDVLTSADATPQEIYNVIKGVVDEEYHYHKHQTGRCYDLLALLNGNGKGHLTCDKDDPSEECKGAWTSFWEEHYYPEEYKGSTVSSVEDVMSPWGHSDMEALRYSEEELNAMCEKAESDYKKSKHYYDIGRNRTYDEMVADGWEMTADGFWWKEPKNDKVKKWVLPVEETKIAETDETEYFVSLPDDLLEAANLKEGDQVEWVDQGNGSYILKKVTRPIGIDEC